MKVLFKQYNSGKLCLPHTMVHGCENPYNSAHALEKLDIRSLLMTCRSCCGSNSWLQNVTCKRRPSSGTNACALKDSCSEFGLAH